MQAGQVRNDFYRPQPAATFLYRLFTQAALAEKIQSVIEPDLTMLL